MRLQCCPVAADDDSTRHIRATRCPGSNDNSNADDSAAWIADYDDLQRARLTRVQSAAQQWLTTITALLGLLSAC